MAFQLSAKQVALQNSVRGFIKSECPIPEVRRIRQSAAAYSPELYAKMARLGWFALGIPREYGGVLGNAIDLCVLHEELGRGLVPGPHTATIIAAQVLLALGSPAQRSSLLPRIVSGQAILTTAVVEPGVISNSDAITTRAERSERGYTLRGTKLFVEHAQTADYLLVLASTSVGSRDGEGTTLFLVDTASPMLARTPLDNLPGEQLSEVALDGVEVGVDSVVGAQNEGDQALRLLDQWSLLRCAAKIGGMEVVVDMTLNHLKERVQYGRPLGGFQVLQYRMLEMVMELDHARLLTYYAAWLASEGVECRAEIAMAKLATGKGYDHITAEGTHMHGGYALAKEHDLSLYFLKAKDAVVTLGSPDRDRDAISGCLYERAASLSH